MRAVVISQPGGPEVLRLAELPDPEPGPGEVVLQVAAAGVNRADLLQRQGHYPPPEAAPAWPGLECSGTVLAVGPGIEPMEQGGPAWAVGDQACALLAGGGYAERVAVPVEQLLPPPTPTGLLDLVDAAALPEACCTVWSNLVRAARLAAGELVLVHGGSSGIGTLAIQVAKALGARVAVTAGSPAKLDRCAELGADVLIDYREQDFVAAVREASAGRGADVILDIVGGAYLGRNVSALARGGRLVVIGLQGGRRAELDLQALLAKNAAVIGTALRGRPLAEKAEIIRGVREQLWPMIARGAVRPVIQARLPLAEAAAAHRMLEQSEHVGKVLLLP